MTTYQLHLLRFKARHQTTVWMRRHRVTSWVLWTPAELATLAAIR